MLFGGTVVAHYYLAFLGRLERISGSGTASFHFQRSVGRSATEGIYSLRRRNEGGFVLGEDSGFRFGEQAIGIGFIGRRVAEQVVSDQVGSPQKSFERNV